MEKRESPYPGNITVKFLSLDVHQRIPVKLIKAGGETLCSEIHRLIYSIRNKEELPQQWKESIIVPIYKKDDRIV
jgi:hypothetical protein